MLPLYDSWIIKTWHFGRDASIEYSGEKFEITFAFAREVLLRVYSK
jgi:hypothetical protein